MTVVKDSTRQLETLNVAEKKAVSSLRTNTDHTILVADKGSAKAVLNTVKYNQKIGTLLQDPPDRKLAKDHTETIQRKTTLVFVVLLKNGNTCIERLRMTTSREYEACKVIWTPQDS